MNLYHYCPNTAFVSIVSNKEIWASEFSLSNDPLEGKWIREVFSQYCKGKEVSLSDQNDLLRHLDALITFSGAAGFCMSEEGDLLSQWRAYADNGAGVSIGFNKEFFEVLGGIKRDRSDNFNASLTKVEYDVSYQMKLISENSDEILKLISEGALRRSTLLSFLSEDEERKRQEKFRSLTLRFMLFFFHLFSLKNPAFAEEREWRIVSHLIHTASDGDFGKIRVGEPYSAGAGPSCCLWPRFERPRNHGKIISPQPACACTRIARA